VAVTESILKEMIHKIRNAHEVSFWLIIIKIYILIIDGVVKSPIYCVAEILQALDIP